VAQLMVRNVDDAVVRELKKRAARRNHSAEQEHREILEQLLLRPRCRSLAEVLAAMPDAGKDADFERRQIDPRTYPVNAAHVPRRHRFLAHGSNRLHRS
jgi:antitoxin FitA